ncbi:MAG: SDR family NAD(P)-dependent oxidoreductase [Acidimicrobiia bacterium]
MTLLQGHAVVVVGAGDIGSQTVARLLELGAVVRCWDRDQAALDRLAELVGPGKAVFTADTVDITDEVQVSEAAERAVATLGRVDGLVNTAAVLHLAPVADLAVTDWRRTLDVNLTGTFLCCRGLLPALRNSGGSSIVNVSSIGGLAGEPEMAHYCASKFGVLGLSQSLAVEEGPNGIRVNTVCPGAVDSRMNDETLTMYASRLGLDQGTVFQDVIARTPLGRLARPRDVADTIAYLLSDLSSFVTGESIAVTGGLR